jgi:putative transposase
MTKNEYPHFDARKYGLDTKISTVKVGSHCRHNINYHIVWIPKYRRKVLTGRVVDVLKEIIMGQCEDLYLEVLAMEVMPDHIHLFVSATPTHMPSQIVKQIKGNSSIQLRRCFKELTNISREHLWAEGYYCGSAGHVSQDAVARYILEQQGKPIFEYNVFNGQGKIGDFTR